ncbi:alkaline phosphatase family protein [Edaphobacter albus]|uniref:alkaline phosphatase family protein n=1 Tax=Edaphobacter sp. 4G125 TaxID=2763071 RepID=UPI0016451DE5|nr:ectonucleotide pyrophosphatase/phosphodiesterase [Edaphobacter sp. 4G125]QNI36218.1 alkaline phosphatase family protein [Edaphobacter sp. 4G125]
MFRQICAASLVFILANSCTGRSAAQTPNHRQKVVVISLDAFGAESLHDPHLPTPTLHKLMQKGTYAVAMHPINPTVTWPNHTSMVTGVNASKHHVIANGLIVDQRSDKQPRIDPDAPKSRLVAVPTVYDAAHKAGLTTAEVDWVAINDADGITWKFPERPNPDGPIEKDLVTQGVVSRDDLMHFGKPSQAWRDRIYTDAAIDIIKKHHPDLLLFHLLALDGIEHQTGFGNDAGRDAIAFLDDRVKDIIEGVKEAGDLDNTAFLIVSDHGQQSVFKHIDGNVMLRQAGLQGPSISNPAYCIPEGGFALIYQKRATPQSTQRLKAAFSGKPGIRAALTPEEAAKEGWPIPSTTDQGPDLLVYAANGFAFANGKSEEAVTNTKEVGAHGYPNTEPLMQAIFIASGAGIAKRGEIPAFDNVDIAPTIARLLNLKLENIDGKELKDVLLHP